MEKLYHIAFDRIFVSFALDQHKEFNVQSPKSQGYIDFEIAGVAGQYFFVNCCELTQS